MDNTIVWIIIAGFYAPLHYIPPILLVMLKASDDTRKACLQGSVLDSTLSMLLAFGIVYTIGLDNMTLAMSILLVAILVPYLRVVRVIMRNRNTEQA